MDAKTAEWLVGQGIGAVLALVMFLIYRKDVHDALNSWRDQTQILTALVQDVSRTLQANTDAVRAATEAVVVMEHKLPHACPMADQVAAGAVEFVARSAQSRLR